MVKPEDVKLATGERQPTTRVNSRDPTGRDRRFSHEQLAQALAGFNPKPKVAL